MTQVIKTRLPMQEMVEMRVASLGREDPLEEAWAPTPVFLPGKSPWTEEPGGLQSMGSQRDSTEAIEHACIYRLRF